MSLGVRTENAGKDVEHYELLLTRDKEHSAASIDAQTQKVKTHEGQFEREKQELIRCRSRKEKAAKAEALDRQKNHPGAFQRSHRGLVICGIQRKRRRKRPGGKERKYRHRPLSPCPHSRRESRESSGLPGSSRPFQERRRWNTFPCTRLPAMT